MAEIVIIGAGPAGLSAALDAAEAGHHCTLVEAGSAVGGMAGSFEFAGQRVDYGSHRLHFALGDRQRARFERLLGDDLQVRPRNGRIRLRDRWIGFPLRTWDLLTHVPPSFGLRVAADIATAPLRRTPTDPTRRPATGRLRRTPGTGGTSSDRSSDSSFDTEVRARLGPTVAEEFYGPYARKLYGIEPVELDAELAHRRVSASGISDVLRRVVRAARPAGRQFLYPRRGYGQLSEAMAAAAVDAGVDLRLDTAAARIDLSAGGVTVHLRPQGRQTDVDGGGQPSTASESGAALGPRTDANEIVRADSVLSTVPVATLASIVEPAPPPAVVDALARCRTRSMVLAYLIVDRDQYTPYDAHYFPGLDTVIARLSEPKNYRDGDDPAGQSVLCAEIPC
ncbi:protoporphyrinogen/coproporphyrinogen oxidase [Candidatus Poriferisodalis sp.]|uniref:protoporphyrinogen/coproporphyrinogen oxidase n=1 Tax=Candidatus Poriferisodalis sp. TaxID=3101277 RepID=UPI003B01F3D0